MASITGTYQSNRTHYPHIDYTVSYSQTGRTATTVTYKFTVTYSRLNGSYGYDVYVNYSVGGKSGNVLLKANNDWSASASCSFSVTCDTNASGGTLYAKIYSWSNTDGTHYQNGFNTGDKDVNRSTFNTAPYWTSGALISLSPNGVVREDTSSVTVSWTAASDAESTSSMKYKVDRYINGNFSATVTSSTTSTSVVDNIGAGNSGNVYTYRVTPTDNYNVSGSALTNSQSLTKNTLTASTLGGSPSIKYDTTSFSFTVSGGSNSMGSGTITRVLSSSTITIYNTTVSVGVVSITVYKSGTTPTTPYIKYTDLVNLYKNATNQSGNFQITLTTTNGYGSSGTSNITVTVDLRTTPNAPSAITISGTKTVGSTAYYIPSQQPITVSWTNGSDKINGAALKYEIQGSASLSSGWRTLTTNIPSGSGSTTSQTVVIPDSYFTGGNSYYFRVIGYNAYNLSASVNSSAITLHKYSPPTISLGIVTRTTSQISLTITTTLNTTIPNTTFASGKRNYSLKVNGTSTFIKTSTALTASPQTITITGLTGEQQYILEVIANDSTGLSSYDISSTYYVEKYIPIMSVRDKGVGINAYADSTNKFVVGGNIKATGTVLAYGFTSMSGGSNNFIFNPTEFSASVKINSSFTNSITAGSTNLLIGSNASGSTNLIFDKTSIQARVSNTASSPLGLNLGGGAVNVGGELLPNTDNTIFLGNSSKRWKQLYAATTTINTSDSRMKDTIVPILDNQNEVNFLKQVSEEEPTLLGNNSTIEATNGTFIVNNPIEIENITTSEDYYNFVKDRLRYYSYNYTINDTEISESGMSIEDIKKSSKSLGFIADEYDLENDIVAKEFLFRTNDNILNYNSGNYVGVLGLALQRAIRKIEEQSITINELKIRIENIENTEENIEEVIEENIEENIENQPISNE